MLGHSCSLSLKGGIPTGDLEEPPGAGSGPESLDLVQPRSLTSCGAAP